MFTICADFSVIPISSRRGVVLGLPTYAWHPLYLVGSNWSLTLHLRGNSITLKEESLPRTTQFHGWWIQQISFCLHLGKRHLQVPRFASNKIPLLHKQSTPSCGPSITPDGRDTKSECNLPLYCFHDNLLDGKRGATCIWEQQQGAKRESTVHSMSQPLAKGSSHSYIDYN